MKLRYIAALSATVLAGGIYGLPAAPSAHAAGQEVMSFKDDVLPIFKVYCTSCHHAPDGQGYKASGLDLTSYQGVMKGSKYGPLVIAGDPDNSNLMWLLDWRAGKEMRMPHGKKQLPVGERDIIRTWIRQGAKDN